ncbi:hypothetical protein [Hyalangium sp.]|uniref:hypothetical protein n=1 Tax=Hyalangium sp. TaxID=2028555 RepID=UPI002D63607D|nr:hypothetical protein [Hyalangium sp.]HYI01422.1 hypothetical protein [Hyalangium sp.]
MATRKPSSQQPPRRPAKRTTGTTAKPSPSSASASSEAAVESPSAPALTASPTREATSSKSPTGQITAGVPGYTNVQVIEVGELPAVNMIVREGQEVRSPALNLARVDAYIDRAQPINKYELPRVIGQSVKSGIRVAKGSVVDLTLAPPNDVTLGLIKDAHLDLEAWKVPQIAFAVQQNQTILDRKPTAAELTPQEREQVIGSFVQYGITIDDEQPGLTFDNLYQVLQGARAFT